MTVDIFDNAEGPRKKRGRRAMVLTEDQKRVANAEMLKGTARRKIAAQIGCSIEVLRCYLPVAVKRGAAKKSFTPKQKQLICAEIARGTSRSEIAALVNCTAPTLRRHLPGLINQPQRTNARRAQPRQIVNLKSGRPRMKFGPEAVVILVKELTKQTPLPIVAELVGCSVGTLRRYFSTLPCWNPRHCGARKSTGSMGQDQ